METKNITVALSETQIAALDEQILAVMRNHVTLGKAYFDLCLLIRSTPTHKAEIKTHLLKRGLHKTRVSEIMKVASAPSLTWTAYSQNAIGFTKALALSRASIKQLTAGGEQLDPAAFKLAPQITPKQTPRSTPTHPLATLEDWIIAIISFMGTEAPCTMKSDSYCITIKPL